MLRLVPLQVGFALGCPASGRGAVWVCLQPLVGLLECPVEADTLGTEPAERWAGQGAEVEVLCGAGEHLVLREGRSGRLGVARARCWYVEKRTRSVARAPSVVPSQRTPRSGRRFSCCCFPPFFFFASLPFLPSFLG